jgi:Mat/Ecp fimbriae major subunit
MLPMMRTRAAAILGAFALWCGAAPAAFAGGAGANSNAVIVQTTTLSSLLELNFGTIASNGAGGVVTLDAGTGNRTCAPGMACSGSFAFATLLVTGDAAGVQLHYDPTVQLTGPGDPMNATIQFPGGQGSVVALVNGQAVVYFGADLVVNANQTAGAYNGTFNVSVNYQ